MAEYMDKASLKDLDVRTIDNTIMTKTVLTMSP